MALGNSIRRWGWALSLLLAACTASGADVEGVTFGSGYDPGPTDDDGTDTEGPLPSVSAGNPTATGGDDSDSDPTADPTGDDPTADPTGESTTGPSGECSPGDTTACYEGPANTENVGQCQSGMATCQADGTWGNCIGAIVPAAEACNGLDDDCNAVVDDGNPGGGGACTTTLLGPCSAGTLQCDGTAVICEPNIAPAASETCGDSVDNDCNGQVDDGCSTATVCDPMFPSPACGASQQCFPSPTGETTCVPTPGLGGQYSACLGDTDCGPGFACVTTGFGSVYCMQWCTNDFDCPFVFDLCNPISPPVFGGLQEYGVCYDGEP